MINIILHSVHVWECMMYLL